jgi:hypothetical protein
MTAQVVGFYTRGRGRHRRVHPITAAKRSRRVRLRVRTPEERYRHYGHTEPMNELAQEMGYPRLEDLPEHLEKEFAERLSRRYGKKSARGMLIIQMVYRKHAPPGTKEHRLREKFRRILEHV